MALVRVKTTQYLNSQKTILAIPDHYVAIPQKIATSEAQTVDGKKYFLAGTPVKDLDTTPTTAGASAGTIEGLIFNTEEVFDGEEFATVTVLVHGFVSGNALDKIIPNLSASTFTPLIKVIK